MYIDDEIDIDEHFKHMHEYANIQAELAVKTIQIEYNNLAVEMLQNINDKNEEAITYSRRGMLIRDRLLRLSDDIIGKIYTIRSMNTDFDIYDEWNSIAHELKDLYELLILLINNINARNKIILEYAERIFQNYEKG